MGDYQRPQIPARRIETEYPLIDSDPHIKRVVGYARQSDYAVATAAAAFPPSFMLLTEKYTPSHVGKGGFAPVLRLSCVIGVFGGFLLLVRRSSFRFYGFSENKREYDMDMREMVDKAKKKEPLYGTSTLTPHMQGVASRNSRYSALLLHIIPWFNFVNHNQHGVDTAKYYRQAERELERERSGG